jgi:hypothetical protein
VFDPQRTRLCLLYTLRVSFAILKTPSVIEFSLSFRLSMRFEGSRLSRLLHLYEISTFASCARKGQDVLGRPTSSRDAKTETFENPNMNAPSKSSNQKTDATHTSSSSRTVFGNAEDGSPVVWCPSRDEEMSPLDFAMQRSMWGIVRQYLRDKKKLHANWATYNAFIFHAPVWEFLLEGIQRALISSMLELVQPAVLPDESWNIKEQPIWLYSKIHAEVQVGTDATAVFNDRHRRLGGMLKVIQADSEAGAFLRDWNLTKRTIVAARNGKIRASKAALAQSNSKGDVASQAFAESVHSAAPVHDEKVPGDVAGQAEDSLHHVKDNV